MGRKTTVKNGEKRKDKECLRGANAPLYLKGLAGGNRYNWGGESAP